MRIFAENELQNGPGGDFLESCKDGRAINVEVLDGFFAAVISGPETVMPSEYYSDWYKTSRLVENASMAGRRGR
jgi:hypothetical protein